MMNEKAIERMRRKKAKQERKAAYREEKRIKYEKEREEAARKLPLLCANMMLGAACATAMLTMAMALNKMSKV